MYKNIQDAREIKDRLLCRGHDVDETVLCELLENVPKFAVDRIEYIISMIADDEDYNFKESLNEAESSSASIEVESKMHHSIEKIPKTDTQNFSIEHNDTIDLSSDSNDDRDFYYQTTNWDDISVVDTMTSSSPSHSLLEVCNVTPPPNQVTIIVDQTAISDNNNYYNNQDAVDIEFLEENNNDPNNNLGFAQMLEDERNNPTIDVIRERNRLSESPKPGCSKDSDDSPDSRIEEQQKDADSRSFDCNGCTAITSLEVFKGENPICSNNEDNVEINVAVNPESRSQTEFNVMVCYNNYKKISDNQSLKNHVGSPSQFADSEDIEELQKNAKQIHALLPRFEYSLIYKTLLNYRSKDRIELTLRDLLSVEKPVTHYTSESESSDKILFTECAKCPDNSPKKNPIDTGTSSGIIGQTCAENEIRVSCINTDNEELVSRINGETDKLKRYIMEVTTMDETDSAQNSLPKKAKMNKDIINGDNSTRNGYSEEPGFSKSLDAKSKNYEEMSIVNDSVVRPVTKKIYQTGASSCTLRPARFTFHANNTYPSSSASVSAPILAPAKFKYNRENQIQTSNANECNTSMELKLGLSTQTIRKAKNLSVKLRDKKKSLNALMNDQKTSLNISHPFGFRHRSTILQSNFTGNPVWSSACTWNKFGKISHSEGTSSNKLLGTFINSKITLRNKTPSNIETKETKLIENADVCTISTLTPLSLPQSSKQTFEAEKDKLYCTQVGETNNMPTTSISKENKGIEDDKSNNLDQQKDRIIELDDKENEEQRTLFFGDVEDRSKTTHKVVRNNVDRTFMLNEKARKIYSKLISMFPCISTGHIKQLCQRSVEDDGQLLDEAVLLQNLAEQLLDFGQEQPSVVKKEPEFEPSLTKTSNTYDVNEQYADLLGIFPEADPVYLRQIAEEMYNDPEGIKEFVQSKLENPDYPTREQYLAKKKITEQQKQYTTDFQVQQFLEIFPDPFSYFEDKKRECRFQSHAIDFLKHYFNKIRVNTLLKLYIECMHNLSLTVKNLEKLSPDMKSKRYFSNKILTEDIPLLQECAFLQHKMEIREHLAELKKKEEEEFNELKANNALLECQCCYDNECMPSKCSTCEDGHIFCNSCIARSTDVVLADGKTQVDCLINCGCGFSLSVLQRILLPTKFSILLQKRQEAEVMAAGLEGLVSCPFCHFASIPPPEDNVFKCFNPDCMKESCRLCKELNHVPLKCNEVKSDAARLYLEEKMTEALVRKCYRCGKMFFKEEGCNKMTCLCGAQMCYICDEPVTNYEHFQGQGASPSKLCPLWSDDLRMNAESVIKVCHETMKHIKEKNPKVDININALLPELPFKNASSPEDIADTLLIRADRIARQIP